MFSFRSIKDFHQDILLKRTSCEEAVRYYLNQIETNGHLNAFLEVYTEEALERAFFLDRQIASGAQPGPLHGVVIGLKDVISYKDHHVSASSHILEHFVSIYNATVVEKLLAAGAIIIGRQNCDEFAMGSSNENSAFANVLNARDHAKVPGGSSGGSAVAVQAGLCMASLGTDTGGSIRQPADFCGVIGFKPSYGRISRYGVIAYASSFDQIGIFANSIPDVAICLEVLAGPDDYDSTVSTEPVPAYSSLLSNSDKKYRITYFKQALDHPALDPEIRRQFFAFTETLTSLGHTVQPIDFDLLEYVVPTYYVLTTAEASTNLSRYDGVKYGLVKTDKDTDLLSLYKKTRSAGFGKEVKQRIMLGTFVLSSGYFDAYFTKAQKVRQLIVQKTKQIFDAYDMIISPTVPGTAFPFGAKTDPIEIFLADIYTVHANLAGIPAVSLPLFTHQNGMPFGMQVMTFQMNEVSLLQISENFIQIAGK